MSEPTLASTGAPRHSAPSSGGRRRRPRAAPGVVGSFAAPLARLRRCPRRSARDGRVPVGHARVLHDQGQHPERPVGQQRHDDHRDRADVHRAVGRLRPLGRRDLRRRRLRGVPRRSTRACRRSWRCCCGAVMGMFLGGVVNGVLIGRVRLNFFVVTLGTSSLFTGALNVVTNGKTNSIPEPDGSLFYWLGNGTVATIPIPVVLSLAVLLRQPLRAALHVVRPRDLRRRRQPRSRTAGRHQRVVGLRVRLRHRRAAGRHRRHGRRQPTRLGLAHRRREPRADRRSSGPARRHELLRRHGRRRRHRHRRPAHRRAAERPRSHGRLGVLAGRRHRHRPHRRRPARQAAWRSS